MFKRILILTFAFILAACGSDNDTPDVTTDTFTASGSFTVTLTGGQVVPSSGSLNVATAVIEYDTRNSLIRASLDISDVEMYSGAAIRLGELTENGAGLYSFPNNGTNNLELLTRVSDTQLDALIDGQLYIELSSSNYPDGELRGQILPANIAVVTFPLSGAQEVPVVTTAASGSGYATYNTDTEALTLTVMTNGVDDATMAHIHTGRVGANGPVLLALESSATGVWEAPAGASLDADTFAVLAGGGHYVNVHTPANPSGEIRGQILTSDFALATFALNGKQEVPMLTTTASGNGYALVNTSSFALELTVMTDGVDDATMAHIHTGRVGENGPVLVGLEQSMTDPGMWTAPAGTAINADILGVLASGGHYVNVHTPANPSGEIRGQILTSNYALVTFGLSGSQEVPAVSSAASGEGYALVNTFNYNLDLRVNTTGVSDATMAHIHTGRIGNNGDVLVALEQSADDMNIWSVPADTALTPEIFAVLASGGHYVNIHTPANPSGEIRGQILTDNLVLVTFGLSGSQEVPAVSTSASGSGYAIVDTNDFGLELSVVTSGVSDATMAHIHTGRIGENGPVLVALEQSMDDANVWAVPADVAIDADIFAVLASGGHYVNVHTPANPGGELRGQILTDNLVLVTFGLSGEQEVPSVDTMATGSGYAIVNTNDFALELKVVTDGVMNATMAHIHTGRVGTNGPVLVALEQSMDDANIWSVPADTALTAEIFTVLASGGHYVNVHTPANPGGELRGQILTDNFVLVTFGLDGEQQVPALDTMASGDGYALVDVNTFALELQVVTQGVMDATMAHIHTGRIGMNGDVLVALEQSMSDLNVWSAPADTALTADIFAVLASGGHYVNVHTPANPSGELRGQILTDNFVLVTFNLSGDQEVPAVTTMADGDGYALVNTATFDLELVANTRGVSDATMAHIHTGEAGSNGPVLVGLEQPMDETDVWLSPVGLQIDADIFAVLAAGGHYVNVHTPANPSGEIRGQIQ